MWPIVIEMAGRPSSDEGVLTPRIGGTKPPPRRKATDEQLIAAYAEHQSVYKVGPLFGMRPSSAHERLVKLGVMKPINVFSDAEKDRLRSEYWIAAETGKLAELAADMGRTKPFICTQARALGLTQQSRKRPYISVWKYMSEESARVIFERFKRSSLNLGHYCKSKEYDDLGFSRCMQRHFPDEWEHVIESKQTKQTLYRFGRQFEYQVRDYLKSLGYFVLRSPASKTPIDLVAIKFGIVAFIQCKRSGQLNPKSWNELYDLAASVGAIAILASKTKRKGALYQQLIGRKDGSGRRQPFTDWDPTVTTVVPPPLPEPQRASQAERFVRRQQTDLFA